MKQRFIVANIILELFITHMLICILLSSALAEPNIRIYGGSGQDGMMAITVSNDGRIAMTGITTSNDGTLSSRTYTEQSGWVLCVDASGNVLWSFCTQQGPYDYLRAPVFHEDGSLTIVQDSKSNDKDQCELIRIDVNGKVITRQVMQVAPDEETSLSVEPVTDEGYILSLWPPRSSENRALFDWNGRLLRMLEDEKLESILWRAKHHILGYIGDELWLTKIGENEMMMPLAQVLKDMADEAGEWFPHDFISLPDGGAAAVIHQYDHSGHLDKGAVYRWDALGDAVFELALSDEIPESLAYTDNRFAVACFSAESQEIPYEWKVVFFDEKGMRTGDISLGKGNNYARVITLPERGIAVMLLPIDEYQHLDTKLVIIPAEDIP